MQAQARCCVRSVQRVPCAPLKCGGGVFSGRRTGSCRSLQKSRGLCRPLRSFEVSGPESSGSSPADGAIDPEVARMSKELMSSMKAKISEALEAEKVEVADVSGDGRHVGIDVIASAFEGKSSVERQRMVYKAIWFELQDAVHAVDAMTTKTPGEAA